MKYLASVNIMALDPMELKYGMQNGKKQTHKFVMNMKNMEKIEASYTRQLKENYGRDIDFYVKKGNEKLVQYHNEFTKMFTFKDESNFDEFEISGSTYEPIGDLFQGGRKVKGSDYVILEELSTIAIMCNDSAIDYNEFKNIFEKVGEATETALITLAEKINPYGMSKSGGRLESA